MIDSEVKSMEKIHSLQQLEDCLKAQNIVCTPDKKGMLYAILYKDSIRVQNEHSRFVLSMKDFLALYGNQTFYIYEEEIQEEIATEKDEEYYGWYHK